jgi:hypothetical protein
MKTDAELETLVKQAAWRVLQAFELFKDEPAHVRQQAEQLIMQHVQRFRNGEQVGIEGAGLVKEIQEPSPPAQ